MKNGVFALVVGRLCFAGVFVIAGAGVACAQSGDGAASGAQKAYVVDCSEINVDYENDPMLTEAEKLALMEQAFYRSLSKFDACQDAVNSNSSSASSASSGGGGGAGADGMEGDTASGEGSAGEGSDSGTSSASLDISGSESSTEGGFEGESASGTMASAESGMSGTEPPATEGTGQQQGQQQGASGGTGTTGANGIIDPVIDGEQTESAASSGESGQNLDNGKEPEDIPSVDNDSVLEAQIRQAATTETDPVIKKRLWNEYRKYKGLPQVD